MALFVIISAQALISYVVWQQEIINARLQLKSTNKDGCVRSGRASVVVVVVFVVGSVVVVVHCPFLRSFTTCFESTFF